MNDQDRPNVRGLKYPEYDRKGTRTLRTWLKYWEGVAAGTRKLTTGSNDTVGMAPDEIAKLTSEITAREAAGMAGPERDASWKSR
jgi:hypothetical protein